MRTANNMQVITPKLDNTAFFILGGDDVPSDIPYAKVKAISKTMSMMEIAFHQDGSPEDPEKMKKAIEALINSTISSMAEKLVEIFDEGTFLVKDQGGLPHRATGKGLVNITTNGYRISITMSGSGQGLEAIIETDVYAPGRHGKVREVHIAGHDATYVKENE